MTDKQIVKTPVGNLKFNNFALEDLEFLSTSPQEAIQKLLDLYKSQSLKVLILLIKAGRIGYEYEYGENLDVSVDVMSIKKWVANASIDDYEKVMNAFLSAIKSPVDLNDIASRQPKGDPEKKRSTRSKAG